MRVAINHETVYRYRSPALYSIQYLRLTPRASQTQRVLSWKLQTPGKLTPWTDAHGNSAHILVLDTPHEEIRVTAVGEIEIADGGRPMMHEGENQPADVYLRTTRLTACEGAVQGFAMGFKPAFAGNARHGLERLMLGIRDAMESKPGTLTNVLSAREALEKRSGMCQDQAHLFLSCARSMGVPARYVSGYLCTGTNGSTKIASHAWAEAWVDDSGWMSYDVANRASNTTSHVRVAVGHDSMDAAPVRAVRSGGGNEDMDIEIQIDDARVAKDRRAQQQQQQQ